MVCRCMHPPPRSGNDDLWLDFFLMDLFIFCREESLSSGLPPEQFRGLYRWNFYVGIITTQAW